MREYLEQKLEKHTGKNIAVITHTKNLDTRIIEKLDSYIVDESRIILYAGWCVLDYTYNHIEHAECGNYSGVILTLDDVDTTVTIYFTSTTGKKNPIKNLATFAAEMGYKKEIERAMESLEETKRWIKETQKALLENHDIWKDFKDQRDGRYDTWEW